jgi:hypothetical protein
MLGSLVNSELEGIWKEAVVEFMETRVRHLPGGTEENQEVLQSGVPTAIRNRRLQNASEKRQSPANMTHLKRLDTAEQAPLVLTAVGVTL